MATAERDPSVWHEDQQIKLGTKLRIADLRPGDIIATAVGEVASRGIRNVTNAPYSHAILYRGGAMGVEAIPLDGVVEVSISETLATAAIADVYRHRTASVAQREFAAKWAYTQINKPYDYFGAARVGMQKGADLWVMRFSYGGLLIVVTEETGGWNADGHEASFFCSELVARAYELAGAPIISRPSYAIGPGALEHTKELIHVGSLK